MFLKYKNLNNNGIELININQIQTMHTVFDTENNTYVVKCFVLGIDEYDFNIKRCKTQEEADKVINTVFSFMNDMNCASNFVLTPCISI